MNKFTGRERLEYVKEYKASGLSEKEFSALKGMSSTILGDWNNAFEIHFGGLKSVVSNFHSWLKMQIAKFLNV